MDEKDLLKLGENLRLGEDLYGTSIEDLNERLTALRAEMARVEAFMTKKGSELSEAELFFKKS